MWFLHWKNYHMNGAKYFSRLDMNHGYNQFQLDEALCPITVFYTHQGLQRFRQLTFGTNSAAEVFHRWGHSWAWLIPVCTSYLITQTSLHFYDSSHARITNLFGQRSVWLPSIISETYWSHKSPWYILTQRNKQNWLSMAPGKMVSHLSFFIWIRQVFTNQCVSTVEQLP